MMPISSASDLLFLEEIEAGTATIVGSEEGVSVIVASGVGGIVIVGVTIDGVGLAAATTGFLVASTTGFEGTGTRDVGTPEVV